MDENDGENDATDNGVFGVDISKEALLPTLEDNVSKHGFNRICMIDFVVMNHYCEGCFFVLCFFFTEQLSQSLCLNGNQVVCTI